MHAERRLEQVIPVLGHLGIDPRIRILQDDVLQRFLEFSLHASIVSPDKPLCVFSRKELYWCPS